MGNVFKGQTLLTVTLETGYDISGATVLRILYKKPNGNSGYWTGTLSGTTKMAYVILAGNIDIAGVWNLQAFATIGGKDVYGEITDAGKTATQAENILTSYGAQILKSK